MGEDRFQLAERLRLAEISLKASEARARTLLELSPFGLLVCGADLSVKAANPKSLELFQVGYADLIGQSLDKFIDGQSELNWPGLSKLVEDKKAIEVYILRDGKIRLPVRIQARQFTDASATPLSISESQTFVFVEDVSREFELERLKREFFAMLSHDIRTPLHSVMGILTMLEEGLLGQINERGQAAAVHVRQRCQAIIRLLNDLLELEKLESGKHLLDCAKISVDDLVIECIDLLDVLAHEQKVSVCYSNSGLSCFGDKTQLTRVLVNLLTNAIKYSLVSSNIIIEAEECGGFLKLSVRDSGKGISPEFISKIFNRYEQVDLSDAKEKGGYGLGLAICRAIVLEHGGDIGVTSNKDEGSCFWFTVPREALPAVSDP